MTATTTISENTTQPAPHIQGRPWNSKEVQYLRRHATLGARTLAAHLDRPENAVRQKARALRISLRQPGSRAGLILGQPRDVSFKELKGTLADIAALEAHRRAVLAGTTDAARIERLAARQAALAAGVPLCPWCARNPQEIDSTGYCTECHLKALAQAHRDAALIDEAQRELWRERQRKVRRNRPANHPEPQETNQ
jgi:hypothetical protein